MDKVPYFLTGWYFLDYMKTKTSKLLFNNTRSVGRVTVLVMPEGKEFVGVCLEFDLVVKEKTHEKAKKQIGDYVDAWLDNAIKNNLPNEVLNRPAPKKYWVAYERFLENQKEKVAAREKAIAINPNVHLKKVFSVHTPYPALCGVSAAING